MVLRLWHGAAEVYITICATEHVMWGSCRAHCEESATLGKATHILTLTALMLLNDAGAQAVSTRARNGAHGFEKLWAIFKK